MTTFSNFTSCACGTPLNDNGACALCQSVEASNLKRGDWAAKEEPGFPIIGTVVLIIAAVIFVGLSTFCTRPSLQPANKIARAK